MKHLNAHEAEITEIDTFDYVHRHLSNSLLLSVFLTFSLSLSIYIYSLSPRATETKSIEPKVQKLIFHGVQSNQSVSVQEKKM